MLTLPCPVIRGYIEKFRDPYPLGKTLVPWRQASDGDCVGLVMSASCDAEPVGRPHEISYLLYQAGTDPRCVGLVDLGHTKRGDLASIAVQLLESHPIWRAIERICEKMPKAADVSVLLTAHAALVHPIEADAYDAWINAYAVDQETPPGPSDVAELACLIVPSFETAHERMHALNGISDMLAWHDRHVARLLNGTPALSLTNEIAAQRLSDD